jgi:Tol biopolymer transport system component
VSFRIKGYGLVRAGLFLIAATLSLFELAAPAHATFPGRNGKIAFVRGGDIWTINPDGTGALNLTNSAETEDAPAWSPDGGRIAFEVGSASNGDRKVWVMNADGSGGTQLGGLSGQDDFEPAWSPDAKQIIFVSCCADDFAFWKMNSDGTGRSEIAGSFYGLEDVDWSPTGDRIAYTEESQICDSFRLLKTAKLDLSDQFLVSPPSCMGSELFSSEPSWSPDAQRIAFVIEDLSMGGADGVYTIKPDGTDPQQIAGLIDHPAWSPDGSKIAIGESRRFATAAGSAWRTPMEPV